MSRSWKELEQDLLEGMDWSPESHVMWKSMSSLCNFIDKNEAYNQLHGTLMEHHRVLAISQVMTEGLRHPSITYLRIKAISDKNLAEFRFIDTYKEDKQWFRMEKLDSDSLINRFVKFADQVGWVKI